MKVETVEEPTFRPFKIVVESQEEVDALRHAFGCFYKGNCKQKEKHNDLVTKFRGLIR